MSEKEKVDQEPPAGETAKVVEATKSRRAFSKLRRELSEEEISSPAVHRLLLDEMDQLENQVADLQDAKDRYHEADKDRAVLQQKCRQHTAMEVMHGFALGLGGVLIGLAPSVWSNQPYGYLSAGSGVCLMVGAVLVRILWK